MRFDGSGWKRCEDNACCVRSRIGPAECSGRARRAVVDPAVDEDRRVRVAPLQRSGQLGHPGVEAATADQKAAIAAYGQAALEAFREVESALDRVRCVTCLRKNTGLRNKLSDSSRDSFGLRATRVDPRSVGSLRGGEERAGGVQVLRRNGLR